MNNGEVSTDMNNAKFYRPDGTRTYEPDPMTTDQEAFVHRLRMTLNAYDEKHRQLVDLIAELERENRRLAHEIKQAKKRNNHVA